jgi:hypothetical protein
MNAQPLTVRFCESNRLPAQVIHAQAAIDLVATSHGEDAARGFDPQGKPPKQAYIAAAAGDS